MKRSRAAAAEETENHQRTRVNVLQGKCQEAKLKGVAGLVGEASNVEMKHKHKGRGREEQVLRLRQHGGDGCREDITSRADEKTGHGPFFKGSYCCIRKQSKDTRRRGERVTGRRAKFGKNSGVVFPSQ